MVAKNVSPKTLVAALVGCLAVLISSLSGAQAAPLAQPKVIGGADVSVSDIPWQVLFIIDSTSVCSGALVSATKIVSAAHCFDGFPSSKVLAWAGVTEMSDRSDSNKLSVGQISIHPGFDAQTFANDIAVITLNKAVPVRLGAASIGLPAGKNVGEWPVLGAAATVSGWGETTTGVTVASNRLQAAVVDVLAAPGSAVCGSYGAAYLPDLQICAGVIDGRVDACQGDSGGPLTIYVEGQPILAGVSSTGLECGLAGYPGLYVRMTTYLSWLESRGIDLEAGGSAAVVATPGSRNQGVMANFQIGEVYPRAVFAQYAGVKSANSRLTVIKSAACTQVRQSVRIDKAGKCRLIMEQGKKSVSVIVTTYPSN